MEFDNIWSDAKTRGDTAQNSKMFEKQGGTPHILLEGIWLGIVIREGGTPHILLEGIWLDIQTRVGTPLIKKRTLEGGTPHIPS